MGFYIQNQLRRLGNEKERRKIQNFSSARKLYRFLINRDLTECPHKHKYRIPTMGRKGNCMLKHGTLVCLDCRKEGG